MGLLNDVKEATKEVATVEAAGASKADRKAKAKERKAAKTAALKAVIAYLEAHPVKELEEQVKLLKPSDRAAVVGVPSITPETLFGDAFKVGAKISALDVFTKHKKGYPEMRKYIKKWAEKGIVVELNAATSTYEVKSVQ